MFLNILEYHGVYKCSGTGVHNIFSHEIPENIGDCHGPKCSRQTKLILTVK